MRTRSYVFLLGLIGAIAMIFSWCESPSFGAGPTGFRNSGASGGRNISRQTARPVSQPSAVKQAQATRRQPVNNQQTGTSYQPGRYNSGGSSYGGGVSSGRFSTGGNKITNQSLGGSQNYSKPKFGNSRNSAGMNSGQPSSLGFKGSPGTEKRTGPVKATAEELGGSKFFGGKNNSSNSGSVKQGLNQEGFSNQGQQGTIVGGEKNHQNFHQVDHNNIHNKYSNKEEGCKSGNCGKDQPKCNQGSGTKCGGDHDNDKSGDRRKSDWRFGQNQQQQQQQKNNQRQNNKQTTEVKQETDIDLNNKNVNNNQVNNTVKVGDQKTNVDTKVVTGDNKNIVKGGDQTIKNSGNSESVSSASNGDQTMIGGDQKVTINLPGAGETTTGAGINNANAAALAGAGGFGLGVGGGGSWMGPPGYSGYGGSYPYPQDYGYLQPTYPVYAEQPVSNNTYYSETVYIKDKPSVKYVTQVAETKNKELCGCEKLKSIFTNGMDVVIHNQFPRLGPCKAKIHYGRLDIVEKEWRRIKVIFTMNCSNFSNCVAPIECTKEYDAYLSLRDWQRYIYVPECEVIIAQLNNGVWKETTKELSSKEVFLFKIRPKDNSY